MNRTDVCNSIISLILYFTQIAWLVYGNYIYFNLPLDLPSTYESNISSSESSEPTMKTEENGYTGGNLSSEEINSEKWLYIALMTTLTIGYVHLMIFAALIVIFVVYTISNCCLSAEDAQSQVGHLSPVKLWLFIDEGIFSLLDDLDEMDQYDNEVERRQVETREEVERRLALDKLDEKPFETVRLDTID